MNTSIKVFDSLLTSSIWCADDTTLRVWIALLLSADKQGRVEGSLPGFASLCRINPERLGEIMEFLRSPDPYSRTTTNEGRRIEDIPGGWRILNFQDYQSKGSRDRAGYMQAYKKKPTWKEALPEDVVKAAAEILKIWPSPEKGDRQPSKDRSGSCPPVPRTVGPALASRLADLQIQGVPMNVCVAIARRAVKDYESGAWIKAAQFFFGKDPDAPFFGHYRTYLSIQREKQDVNHG